MPTYKLVFEYTESNGSSFNEVFYRDAADIATAKVLPFNTVSARLPMLHPLNTLRRIRVSNTTALRDTGTINLNLPGLYGGTSGPLPVGDAAVLALAGVGGGSRKLWMRGIPDAYQFRDTKSGRDAPPPFFVGLLTDYFAALNKDQLGIRRLTPPAAGPLSNFKIVSVDGTAKNGQSILTFAQAPGFPFPGQIVIGGASKKDLPSLNGVYSIIQNLGLTVVIAYQTPNGLLVLTTTAKARQALYQATAVIDQNACSFDHYGTRTSKNPLSRSRGARRAARLRLSL